MFFFNDTATTEIYTLSLHDALPIFHVAGALELLEDDLVHRRARVDERGAEDGEGSAVLDVARCTEELLGRVQGARVDAARQEDRKSTRLNSSHANISYAVFCLKKKI